ncbi:MAG TPA: hypothetical protein VJV79_22145 [Polyangiaceae bacterium]|nr:hypothetical protein [Polyangiaceae bacterium]
MILTAVSCSVYDASLLEPPAGSGGTDSGAGNSGVAGEETEAGRGGSAGKPAVNGGSSGSSGSNAGDAGMDNAGAMETGGEAASGGSAGTGGGSAGSAGTGGTSGGGTSGGGTSGGGASGGGISGGGTGGTTGGAGTGGSPTASGCAKLSVPLDDTNDRAHFVISLPAAVNLSSATATISMHLYVQAGAAGTVFNYVQDAGNRWFGVATAERPLLSSVVGWQTLTFGVGAQPETGGIVKTDIRRIGIEINAAPAGSGWSKPTVVYVDSITVAASPLVSYTFDMSNTISMTASGSDVSGQVLWLHNGSTDTTAAGVTLTWQQTCP